MNLGEIRTALQDLGYGTDTATLQTRAINSVHRRIEGQRRWPWQEATSASATLALGASSLASVPADLLHIDTVRLSVGTTYLDLDWERPVEVRRLLHEDRDNGAPTCWSNWNSQIIVYPRADLAYAATLDYVKDTTDLAADGDVPLMPLVYHDIYVWGAAQILAARERDGNLAGLAKQEFQERMNEMEQELGVRQRQTAREVVRSSFWDQL